MRCILLPNASNPQKEGTKGTKNTKDILQIRMNSIDTHIAPGDSAAGSLRQALAGNHECEVLVHRDMLSYGPLPAASPFSAAWRKAREDFCKASYRYGPSADDCPDDLLSHARRLADSRSITLWIGTGLAEQLLLACVVASLRDMNADFDRFRVVQFDRARNGGEIVGVGILSADALRASPPATALSNDAFDELMIAWAAITGSTPHALLAFLGQPRWTVALLRRSLPFLLDYYPDATSGLNAWEERLLHHVRANGPTAVQIVGFTMGDAIDLLDWPSDDYLFWRICRMGDSQFARPFLALSGNTDSMLETQVRLTLDGEAALYKRAHFIELNGIDDHVAGVHLNSSSGDVWYRRGGSLIRATS